VLRQPSRPMQMRTPAKKLRSPRSAASRGFHLARTFASDQKLTCQPLWPSVGFQLKSGLCDSIWSQPTREKLWRSLHSRRPGTSTTSLPQPLTGEPFP